MKGLSADDEADLALRISASEEFSPQNISLDFNFTRQSTVFPIQISDLICIGDLFVLPVSSSTETYLQLRTSDSNITSC